MDHAVGGPLIPTVPLNSVLNQETVVQDSHFHLIYLLSMLPNNHVFMFMWAAFMCACTVCTVCLRECIQHMDLIF